MPDPSAPTEIREVVLTRMIDAPAHKLFRCWTEPELMKQWLAPKPWTIARAEVDPRPGGGKTRYTAVARHRTAEDRAAHEKMGFHEGWGKCADQLAELATTL